MTTPQAGAAIVPVIRVPELRATLSVEALAPFSGDPLIAYLQRQRWFGAKGAAPTDARIVDVVPLPWDEGRVAVAIVEVVAGDTVSRYQLPLSVRRIDADALAGVDPRAVIASLEGPDGRATLIDATHDPAFQQGVGQAFSSATTFDSPAGTSWTFETVGRSPIAIGTDASVRLGSAEQSNTALIFDGRAFLKLFRRLERGVQPDIELTRFLTVDAGFPHVPPLFGIITYRDQSGDAVAGMMQEYLPDSRDAWSHILEIARPGASGETAMRDVERLGRVTREMHDSLAAEAARRAGADFAPEPASATDVERWAQRTKQTIREALGTLDRQRGAGKLDAERSAEADALVRRRDQYLRWVDELADAVGGDGGERIRIHGDYHLGQVLRTRADSFVVIDFEGEPTRPLAERREKTSALRDVAGMLRSLAYAAATLVQMEARSGKDMKSHHERELVSGRWERDARAAFLKGYSEAARPGGRFLPQDEKRRNALLALFEAEKAFYELSYELNHRPGWEWIPMRGISRLLMK